MEYNLSGKISLDDYIQFNKTHQNRGFLRIFRPIIYLALFIFIVFACVPNIEILAEAFKRSPLDFFKIWLPVIFWLIFLILFNTIGMRLIYKRHYKSNKKLQEIQNIKITEQCISIITETGNTNLTKEFINKILYDKDAIYIYPALNLAHILKKRFLENENDFDDLVKFVKTNFGKK